MTDKELAVAILEMLGYENAPHSPWWLMPMRKPIHQYWALRYDFGNPHRLAAEVKEFMRKRDWFSSDILGRNGSVYFWKDMKVVEATLFSILGERAYYANMDEHPRAVCEAAIAALEAEKVETDV